jgi:copper chaperone CopZ
MTNFAAIKNKYETKMKNLFLLLTIWLTASNLQAAQPTDTLTWRIKSMRCEDCAHKVNNALRKNPAIDGVSFDLEKRTVTIAYDGTRTCPDSIVNNLRGTRYKPSPYDPTEVIHRGIGLQMADMHCQNCANRIMKRLSEVEGVDSIAPHVDKHYVFFRYDANKTTKATIREILQGMGFTPVNYYTSKEISFAYFKIAPEQVNDETIDTALALDGVDDANVSKRQRSLAITYVNTETNEQKLLEGLKAAGIEATVPAPHECKEKTEK